MTDIPFFFDVDPVVRVQQLLGLGWPLPWELVSLLGSTWGILLVVGLALWLWGRGAAYGILAVVVVDGVLKTALNWLFHVPRPDGAELVKYERVDVGSFPSGHVSTATGLWGYLAYRGLIPWTLAIVVVVLESISRLYLGVHFIGDVLGGILLGAIAIGLVGRLWPPVRGWLARRSFGFFVGAAAVVVAGVLAGAFFYFGDNPYRWRAGGMVAGLAIALPLEYRFVRYHSDNVGAGTRVLMVVIGVAGIAAMAAIDQYSGQRSNSLGLAATGLAAL
ncbi:MAG: phosphatase PAP2 family protein, partial [Gemmatimonadota bacterium]